MATFSWQCSYFPSATFSDTDGGPTWWHALLFSSVAAIDNPSCSPNCAILVKFCTNWGAFAPTEMRVRLTGSSNCASKSLTSHDQRYRHGSTDGCGLLASWRRLAPASLRMRQSRLHPPWFFFFLSAWMEVTWLQLYQWLYVIRSLSFLGGAVSNGHPGLGLEGKSSVHQIPQWCIWYEGSTC